MHAWQPRDLGVTVIRKTLTSSKGRGEAVAILKFLMRQAQRYGWLLHDMLASSSTTKARMNEANLQDQ